MLRKKGREAPGGRDEWRGGGGGGRSGRTGDVTSRDCHPLTLPSPLERVRLKQILEINVNIQGLGTFNLTTRGSFNLWII